MQLLRSIFWAARTGEAAAHSFAVPSGGNALRTHAEHDQRGRVCQRAPRKAVLRRLAVLAPYTGDMDRYRIIPAHRAYRVVVTLPW